MDREPLWKSFDNGKPVGVKELKEKLFTFGPDTRLLAVRLPYDMPIGFKTLEEVIDYELQGHFGYAGHGLLHVVPETDAKGAVVDFHLLNDLGSGQSVRGLKRLFNAQLGILTLATTWSDSRECYLLIKEQIKHQRLGTNAGA